MYAAKNISRSGRLIYAIGAVALLLAMPALAAAPSAGGNTTVVSPSDGSAIAINEDAVQPESANIRLVVSTLTDGDGGTPSKIRILSVSGGTLWDSGGGTITLGSAGTKLSLTTGYVNLRFRPDAGRDTDATFQYVVVDVQDESINSSASTATITINPVNDSPVLQTLSGDTGIGLAATYYIDEWDLTGATYQRIDSTINFSNNFGVTGMDLENFSVRWSGQVKSPITGNVTFSTSTDDGVRLWVDDELIIDNWTLHGETVDTASPVSLVAGEKYSIRMEFYERGGGEVAKLRWAYTGQSTTIIPQAYLFPATTRPTLNYVNGSASAIVDDAITVSDVDSSFIGSGAVVISSNYQSSEDSLLFTDQNGITGSYSAGTLRLTGSASLANYQTALRSVRYANSSGSPTTDTRTVTFTITDTSRGQSNSTYRNISFTATNTAPVITTGTSTGVTMDQNGSPIAFALTLTATDAEYQSLVWSVSSAASHGTASATGTGDSISVSYTPTTDYNGSDSFVVRVSDGIDTDTITVNVTITERNPPVISNIAATASGSTGMTVTWTTDENASTKVRYGMSSSYSMATGETDTSSRVTSHTKIMSGLLACTTYHYAVVSTDASSNTATSSDGTFTTGGCAGNADIRTSTGTSVIANGNGSTGSIILSASIAKLDVPSGYIATNATCPGGAQFQMKQLSTSPVKEALGAPSGRDTIVNALNLSAYCPDATPVTSFDESLTVTFNYSDSDVSGLVESSLGAYRYGSGSTAWEELTCSQDASANTLTCGTTHFSSFALFGTPTPASSSQQSTAAGGGGGGCRGAGCKPRAPSTPPPQTTTDNDAAAVDSLHPVTAQIPGCVQDTLPVKNGKLLMSVDAHPVIFSDIATKEWFACPVWSVVSRGIFSGYRDERGNATGLYGPADSITLGQLAKVALQLRGHQVSGITTGKNWATPYMTAAESLGLSAFGKKLNPGTPATRGAVLQTILEVLDIPLVESSAPYFDVPADSMYAKAVSTGTTLGIVSGDDNVNTFRPNAPINRAEVAKMIVLALEKKAR